MQLWQSFLHEAAIVVALLAVVLPLEWYYGRRQRAGYVTRRHFRHDLLYWFYYRLGFNGLLYTGALLALLDKPLAFLDIGLASWLPAPVIVVLAFLIADMTGYWAHRLQHRFAFLWAFHTTHHSQPDVNVFTGSRFHPVDALWLVLFAYVPMRIIGGSADLWPWLATTLWVVNMLIHSRMPWSYGPLYKIVVSPDFHAFHHSPLPEHHDKNYSSGILSVWDYLFGTAARDGSPVPQVFGLGGPPPRSFLDTLVEPFRVLARSWRPAAPAPAPAAPKAD